MVLQIENELIALMLPEQDEDRLTQLLESIRIRFDAVQDVGADLQPFIRALIQNLNSLS